MKRREFELDFPEYLIKGEEVIFDEPGLITKEKLFITFFKKETDPLGNSYVRRINGYSNDYEASFDLAVLLAKELSKKINA